MAGNKSGYVSSESGILASPEIKRSLDYRLASSRAARLRPYVALNLLFVFVLSWDVLVCDCALSRLCASVGWQWTARCIEHSLLCVCTVNALMTLFLALKPYIGAHPILLTFKQKQLLAVRDKEPGFRQVSEPVAKSTPLKSQTLGADLDWLFRLRSAFRQSPLVPNSSSVLSLSGSASPSSPFESLRSYTPTAPTPSFGLSSGSSISLYSYPSPCSPDASAVESPSRFSQALVRLRRANACSPSSQHNYIKTEEQLRDYLAKYEESSSQQQLRPTALASPNFNASASSYEIGYVPLANEKKSQSALLLSFGHSPSDSFVQSPLSAKSPGDRLVSTSSMVSLMGSGSRSASKSDLSFGGRTTKLNSAIWLKYDVDPDKLDVYVQNLRNWISRTILKRLVNQIDRLNKRFALHSRPDLHVGEAPLASLQHALLTLGGGFRSLRQLIPYLELTSNQQYLVQRLRDLAKDGCLMHYHWNAGGAEPLAGGGTRPWEEHLPSDAQLVWHVWCSYLDAQLPPNPVGEQGKPFSSLYTLRTPAKPSQAQKAPSSCYIHQTGTDPSHFELVVSGGEETIDIEKGRYNLWHAIILFLKALDHGEAEASLGSVRLGSSGLNIMWIFDD